MIPPLEAAWEVHEFLARLGIPFAIIEGSKFKDPYGFNGLWPGRHPIFVRGRPLTAGQFLIT